MIEGLLMGEFIFYLRTLDPFLSFFLKEMAKEDIEFLGLD